MRSDADFCETGAASACPWRRRPRQRSGLPSLPAVGAASRTCACWPRSGRRAPASGALRHHGLIPPPRARWVPSSPAPAAEEFDRPAVRVLRRSRAGGRRGRLPPRTAPHRMHRLSAGSRCSIETLRRNCWMTGRRSGLLVLVVLSGRAIEAMTSRTRRPPVRSRHCRALPRLPPPPPRTPSPTRRRRSPHGIPALCCRALRGPVALTWTTSSTR